MIKLLKDYQEFKAGSIIACDEITQKELIDGEIATKDFEVKSEEVLVEEVKATLQKNVAKKSLKKEDKIMENEMLIGKMFAQIAKKTITGNSETSSAADGGDLVFTGIAELAPIVMANSIVYSKCRKIPVMRGANAMKVPFSIGNPWVKATAPVLTNPAEGVAGTATKLQFGSRTLTMTKSQIPVFVTEELMEDVASMDAYVRSELAGKMAAILDYEILVGGGGGFTAVIGDTGYTAVQSFTGTPTMSELNACVGKVLGTLNPEFYMSLTQWNIFVNTFGNSAGNIGGSIVNIGAKTLMGYKVNVVPYLGTNGLVFGDFSRYTVIEAPIADKLQISNEVRFLEGEIVFKLTHRGAGAITTANLATVDSLTMGAFVSR